MISQNHEVRPRGFQREQLPAFPTDFILSCPVFVVHLTASLHSMRWDKWVDTSSEEIRDTPELDYIPGDLFLPVLYH